MVFGLSSFAFGWAIGTKGFTPLKPMTELDLLQKTLTAGLTCLQMGDNIPLHLFSTDRLEQFRTSVSQNDLRLEVGARKLTREHLNTYLDIAIAFKSPVLRFVIDGDRYEPDSAEIISIIKEFYRCCRRPRGSGDGGPAGSEVRRPDEAAGRADRDGWGGGSGG